MNENLCCYGFLIGKSNKEAAEACFGAVRDASEDGKIILVYGESGCGKTQLMNATHKLFRENFPNEKTTTVTLEQLVEAYMGAIDSGNKADFDRKCAENKLLLLDDVGFLAGKTSTQESLTALFKSMALSGSTVILFSEYSPKRFGAFDDLLCSPGYTVVQIKKADAKLRKSFLDKCLSDADISASPEDKKRVFRICGKDFSSINAYVLKLSLSLMLSGSARNGKAVGFSGVLYDEKL